MFVTLKVPKKPQSAFNLTTSRNMSASPHKSPSKTPSKNTRLPKTPELETLSDSDQESFFSTASAPNNGPDQLQKSLNYSPALARLWYLPFFSRSNKESTPTKSSQPPQSPTRIYQLPKSPPSATAATQTDPKIHRTTRSTRQLKRLLDTTNQSLNNSVVDEDDDDIVILDHDPTIDQENKPRRSRRQKRRKKNQDRQLKAKLQNYKKNAVLREGDRIRSVRVLPSDSEDDEVQDTRNEREAVPTKSPRRRVINDSGFDEEVNNEPAVDLPLIELPVVEDHIMEVSMVEEPVVEQPVVEESMIEEPVVEDTPIEESMVEQNVIEEPSIEEPVIEEPVIEKVNGSKKNLDDDYIVDSSDNESILSDSIQDSYRDSINGSNDLIESQDSIVKPKKAKTKKKTSTDKPASRKRKKTSKRKRRRDSAIIDDEEEDGEYIDSDSSLARQQKQESKERKSEKKQRKKERKLRRNKRRKQDTKEPETEENIQSVEVPESVVNLDTSASDDGRKEAVASESMINFEVSSSDDSQEVSKPFSRNLPFFNRSTTKSLEPKVSGNSQGGQNQPAKGIPTIDESDEDSSQIVAEDDEVESDGIFVEDDESNPSLSEILEDIRLFNNQRSSSLSPSKKNSTNDEPNQGEVPEDNPQDNKEITPEPSPPLFESVPNDFSSDSDIEDTRRPTDGQDQVPIIDLSDSSDEETQVTETKQDSRVTVPSILNDDNMDLEGIIESQRYTKEPMRESQHQRIAMVESDSTTSDFEGPIHTSMLSRSGRRYGR